jgi:hypothetical protein
MARYGEAGPPRQPSSPLSRSGGRDRQRKGPARRVRTGPVFFRPCGYVAAASRLPRRLRATRVAAAAPNSRIIGGAGTWVPPVELDDPPLEDEELEVELDELELLLDEDELEPLVLPDPPKLLEPPVAPELVVLLLVDPPVAPELVEVDDVE